MEIRYRYTGNAQWIRDAQSGSGQIWRGHGDVQPIEDCFVDRFEAVYGAYFERIDNLPETVTEDMGQKTMPVGTPYSALSPADLRKEYMVRKGIKPNPKMPLSAMVKQLMAMDALDQSVQSYQEALLG